MNKENSKKLTALASSIDDCAALFRSIASAEEAGAVTDTQAMKAYCAASAYLTMVAKDLREALGVTA